MVVYNIVVAKNFENGGVYLYQGGQGYDSPQRSPNTMKAYINE